MFLRKLLDCLGYAQRDQSVSPRVANLLQPVCDADVAWGWQGYLFATGSSANPAANAIVCSVTITEDCFYILDASATYVDSPGVASTNSRRVALEILDLAGKTCWSLAYTTVSVFQTAVGLLSVGAAPVQTLRLHLLKDMVVQWRVIDAGTGNSAIGAGIALRKLYQETH